MNGLSVVALVVAFLVVGYVFYRITMGRPL